MGDDETVVPRLGRRELVQEMHHHLDELLAARDQTEKLLDVILGISSDLESGRHARSHRERRHPIDRCALRRPWVSANPTASSPRSFIRGSTPSPSSGSVSCRSGKGVLGVPLQNSPTLRLDDLAEHPAAAGFPPHHPPMHAFLGVPITVRGTVFGSLYVTHDQPGRTFSESDETAARVLASAAAVAIDNAQLFERVTGVRKVDTGEPGDHHRPVVRFADTDERHCN